MRACEWAVWQGGPHVLLPAPALPAWEGGRPPTNGRVVQAVFRAAGDGPATDYDRACDVNDLIGAVVVGDHTGLVIGDEVPMSTH